MSDRGTPDGYRHTHGYSAHTFSLINAVGDLTYCKWYFQSNQGIKNLMNAEADALAGTDPDYSQRDLLHTIDEKDFPS